MAFSLWSDCWSDLIGDGKKYFGFKIEPEDVEYVFDDVTVIPCPGPCKRVFVVLGRDCPYEIGSSARQFHEGVKVVVETQWCICCGSKRSHDDRILESTLSFLRKVEARIDLVRRMFGRRFTRFTLESAGSIGKGVEPYLIVLRDLSWCRRQGLRFAELTEDGLRPIWRKAVIDFLPVFVFGGVVKCSKVLRVLVWPHAMGFLGEIEGVLD